MKSSQIYKLMKKVINKKLQSREEVTEKLDVFFAVGKLDTEQYQELSQLVIEKYGPAEEE